MMRAVLLLGYGDVDQLVYRDVPVPEPGPGEVLVKNAASGVNPVDWKLRKGNLQKAVPLEFPAILGRECAGEVVGTGQKVMGVVWHSYAEYLAVPESELSVIPQGLAMDEAAALPVALLTGALLIETGVKATKGETILVTGALGGVGRAAVFAAKELGAHVIAGVRTSHKAAAAELNADQVVAIDDDNEIAALPQLDAIADTVSRETILKLLPKLKAGGRLGAVTAYPEAVKTFDVQVTSISVKPNPTRLDELAQSVVAGKLRIPIAKRFPLMEAAEAQKTVERGGAGGKIVLVI